MTAITGPGGGGQLGKAHLKLGLLVYDFMEGVESDTEVERDARHLQLWLLWSLPHPDLLVLSNAAQEIRVVYFVRVSLSPAQAIGPFPCSRKEAPCTP